MYVYKKTAPDLWTVGFYEPDGKWQPESDHGSSEAAAERCAWLNGSRKFKAMLPSVPQEIERAFPLLMERDLAAALQACKDAGAYNASIALSRHITRLQVELDLFRKAVQDA